MIDMDLQSKKTVKRVILIAEKDKDKLYYNGLIILFFNQIDPQQCLYFFPDPHGQGSFLPIFFVYAFEV